MRFCKLSVLLFGLFMYRAESTKIHVAVVFNGAKLAGIFNSILVNNSFEIMQSTLKTNRTVDFVYTDLNSSFCNLGKFLSLFDVPRSPPFELVVLIEHCSCERKLSRFVDLLNIMFVSSCGQPVMTVRIFT